MHKPLANFQYGWPRDYKGEREGIPHTAISRKVVGKNVHATTPKGNMGYDQYTVSNDCSCRTYLCCFLLALANVCPWPLVLFFQNSLENRAGKTTHNTFRDCRVPFFWQPFSKQLYTPYSIGNSSRVIFRIGIKLPRARRGCFAWPNAAQNMSGERQWKRKKIESIPGYWSEMSRR